MTLSRRQLLRAAGVVSAGVVLPTVSAPRAVAVSASPHQVVLHATVAAAGHYVYLPFEVPAGVNRLDVSLTKSSGDTKVGVGLFDHRGPGYQSPGFRGIYGEERSAFFVSAHAASQSFLPTRIEPGTWTVVVPVFRAPTPTEIVVTVTMTSGRQRRLAPPPRPVGVVRPEAGWYRGDLHCHTPESSDAWASKTALSPAEWARTCRDIGLDFAALTDHNVVSQNLRLSDGAGTGTLLMAGEEMTNWFHGHATVSGVPAGEWVDWRQRPAGLTVDDYERRVTDMLDVTRQMGAYTSAAHPMLAHLSWQFFPEAEADPDAMTDGIEVWTSQFRPDCQAALEYWDSLLVRGRRVFANGGSDLHGTENNQGVVAGTPTTVVYADELSTPAIVAGLRRGRSFVTRLPDGVEIYLTAAGPGGQREFVGGTVYGDAGDTVEVAALVRKGAGMRLLLWANGAAMSVTPLTSDEQTVTAALPIGAGGYVRAEVHGEPFIDPAEPIAGRLDMEAFTNPIFLVQGRPPDDRGPSDAPPPASAPPPAGAPGRRDDARRTRGGGGGQVASAGAAAQPTLPATGGAAPLGGAALVAAGAAAGATLRGSKPADAVAMTLTEVTHHAGTSDDLAGRILIVVGRLTGETELTRWVRACSHDERAVTVDLEMAPDGLSVGDWARVEAVWVPGTGAAFASRPRLRVLRAWRISAPSSHLEG